MYYQLKLHPIPGLQEFIDEVVIYIFHVQGLMPHLEYLCFEREDCQYKLLCFIMYLIETVICHETKGSFVLA